MSDTQEWPADASTAASSVPSVDMIDQWTADRTGRPIEEVRAARERQSEIDRAAAAEREATLERALEMMTPAEAAQILTEHVLDDPDTLEQITGDEWRRVQRAVEIVAAILEVARTIAPIVERATETSWLVDSIADVLDNGSGNTADEREAALDVVEMMIQARIRVFAALGLTQRHLVKGSEITEERTVWVDQ